MYGISNIINQIPQKITSGGSFWQNHFRFESALKALRQAKQDPKASLEAIAEAEGSIVQKICDGLIDNNFLSKTFILLTNNKHAFNKKNYEKLVKALMAGWKTYTGKHHDKSLYAKINRQAEKLVQGNKLNGTPIVSKTAKEAIRGQLVDIAGQLSVPANLGKQWYTCPDMSIKQGPLIVDVARVESIKPAIVNNPQQSAKLQNQHASVLPKPCSSTLLKQSISTVKEIDPNTSSSLAGLFKAEVSEMVPKMKEGAYGILVDGHNQALYLIRKTGNSAQFLKRYTISTAKNGYGYQEESYKTPPGLHRIYSKVEANPGEIIKGRIPTKRYSQNISTAGNGKEERTLVTCSLYLQGLTSENKKSNERGICIHGTNNEGELGNPASRGCIDMSSKDIRDLAGYINNKHPERTYVYITKREVSMEDSVID
ncbi:L,D-transpeptidase [Candidatus Margulisiibacteriota bacterium]